MSRATLPSKVGVVMALAAFVIGITAANAVAWQNEQPPPTTPQHGDNDNHKGDKGEEEHEGKGEKQKPQPQPPTPPAGQQTPPAPAATPPAPAPTPAPVVSQGVTPAPEQPVSVESVPPKKGRGPQSPVVAQAPPAAGAPATPVAERNQLARTGLDPALIALLGALCLGGGGLLFRRALARN
jgi:hypothetical protein